MAKRRLRWGLVIAAVASATAFAQDDEEPMISEEEVTPEFAREWSSVGISARGGIADFTGGLGEFTSAGGLWGIQAEGSPLEFVGFEVAYEGSNNPLSLPDRDIDGSITRNGVVGLAKVNAVINEDIRPFAGVGLGFSYMDPSGDASNFFSEDIMTEVPFAVGVDWQPVGALKVGARADWSYLSGESWAEQATLDDNPNGGLISGALTVGGSF